MNDGTQDRLKVSFPASPNFTRIGQVAIQGLAMRLNLEMTDLDRLCTAVEETVHLLQGEGRININIRWAPHTLVVTVANPDEEIPEESKAVVASRLLGYVDDVRMGRTGVDLTLADGPMNG